MNRLLKQYKRNKKRWRKPKPVEYVDVFDSSFGQINLADVPPDLAEEFSFTAKDRVNLRRVNTEAAHIAIDKLDDICERMWQRGDL